MALGKTIKSEGGQGGGRGHSNMTHWEYTEDIKKAARKFRRREAKDEIQKSPKSSNTE